MLINLSALTFHQDGSLTKGHQTTLYFNRFSFPLLSDQMIPSTASRHDAISWPDTWAARVAWTRLYMRVRHAVQNWRLTEAAAILAARCRVGTPSGQQC